MLSEIHHALRRLRATPVVTLSAIACLSIGVWMTCIMTAVGFGFFRPDLGMPRPDRVVQLDELGLYATNHFTDLNRLARLTSRSAFDSLKKLAQFSAIGHYLDGGPRFIEGDQNWHLSTEMSSGMMGILGVVPILGRGFIPADDTVGGVVLIGEQLWRTRYGGDSAIVGKYLRLKGETTSRTIVGVVSRKFAFPRRFMRQELYVPPRTRGRFPPFPAVQMLARLADGVDRGDAEAAARAIATRSIAADRAEMTQWYRTVSPRRQPPTLASGGVKIRLERYLNEPTPPEVVTVIVLILACGFAVVGIAAANVINLLLVRGAVRRPEIAVRMAMGASRMRVVRELVIEAALLALPAIAIGLIAANRQWAALDPSFNARHLFGDVDVRVAGVAVVGGTALTLVVALWPALRATAFGLEHAMRDARRSGITASPLDGVLGRLVAASTAVTVVLLIAATLLGLSAQDSFSGVSANDRGTLSAVLTFDDNQAPDQRLVLARETVTRLRGLPGVATAAFGSGDVKSLTVSTPASQVPTRRFGAVEIFAVTDGYFETMSIPILRGRGFSVREARDSIGRVVINRVMASRMFPGRNGVGERFRYFRLDDSTVVDAEVIGIAEDVVEGTAPTPQMYLTLGSLPLYTTTALVRYRLGSAPQVPAVTAMLRDRPGITASNVVSLAERARRSNPTREYISFGFKMFAVVGLILAIIGTYGVVAYSVVRRTHEIGVRMALGAEGSRVTSMVIGQGMKITLVGLLVGLPLSIGVMRVLGGFVQDVSFSYPTAIGGVIALVILLSFIASAIPALRAGRLNPVDALRAE